MASKFSLLRRVNRQYRTQTRVKWRVSSHDLLVTRYVKPYAQSMRRMSTILVASQLHIGINKAGGKNCICRALWISFTVNLRSCACTWQSHWRISIPWSWTVNHHETLWLECFDTASSEYQYRARCNAGGMYCMGENVQVTTTLV